VFTLRTPKDELLYYVGVERDITARKQLERQLRQTQNLETVGRLAAGIAHDFNNLLTVITGYSQLALSELATDDPWHDTMTQIDRAAALTQQLMNFSQQQEVHATAVDLNTVVTDAERLLRQRLGEPITLTTILARDLGLVLANPHQLGQVIMNLASNARDAMPQGGTLTIETASVEPSASMDPASSSRSLVRLIVRDTGCGMAAETRDRIFEPFFTTKRVEEVGKGYGLGLAVVHGIITQSGGTIEVDSELGRGTTITIDLPRIAAQRQTQRPAPSLLARRAGTILLVEDDAALRTMVRVVLQKQGYTVLEAGDGIQALAVADQHPTIHLLVTDMVMPGMGGKAVAERLVAQRSGLKVLSASSASPR
jgi:signal transduction histidine kinase